MTRELWDKLNHIDVFNRTGICNEMVRWYDLFYWTDFLKSEQRYLTSIMEDMIRND